MNSVKAMNNKYSSKGGRDGSIFRPRKNRSSIVVICVLLAVLAAVAVYSVNAIIYRSEAQNLFVTRIQSECGNALTLTNSLSRTAGTNSSATLGKIRGSVYTIETLSDMYLALNHTTLIEDTVLDALYLMIDEYNNKLLTGMTTGDMQSSLVTQLQALQTLVNGL